MKRAFVIFFILMFFSIVFFRNFLINHREKKLMIKGGTIVEKIEQYKVKHNKLPSSLLDIGFDEKDGMDVLYYCKRDSIHYTVSFPISSEEHKFYYSDSKKWEIGYRDMDSVSESVLNKKCDEKDNW